MSNIESEVSPDEALKLEAATAINVRQKFNADSNRVFLAGTRQYPDFEESISRLKGADVPSDDFILQALELDDPAKVLHQLGQEENLETAKKLARMTPVKRAAALAALERGEPVSDKAAVPMWKRSRADLGNESLSDKEWGRLWDRKYLSKR